MDLAICTRCQSSNPVFTKYCLTCGLAITADMKKKINIVASAAMVAVSAKTPLATASISSSAAAMPVILPAQTEAQATQAAQTAKEKEKEKDGATGWLRGLRFLTRS